MEISKLTEERFNKDNIRIKSNWQVILINNNAPVHPSNLKIISINECRNISHENLIEPVTNTSFDIKEISIVPITNTFIFK